MAKVHTSIRLAPEEADNLTKQAAALNVSKTEYLSMLCRLVPQVVESKEVQNLLDEGITPGPYITKNEIADLYTELRREGQNFNG